MKNKKDRLIKLLKKSVRWWNWYRRYTDFREVDLSGADLRRADLSGADLRRANLSCANLSYANLSSANLSSANLSYAGLRRANLSGADLAGTDIDFSAIPLKCSSFDIKIDKNIAGQWLLHFLKFQCDDKLVKKVQNLKSVKELASKYKRVKSGEIKI